MEDRSDSTEDKVRFRLCRGKSLECKDNRQTLDFEESVEIFRKGREEDEFQTLKKESSYTEGRQNLDFAEVRKNE